jgi:hypothetical protein
MCASIHRDETRSGCSAPRTNAHATTPTKAHANAIATAMSTNSLTAPSR